MLPADATVADSIGKRGRKVYAYLSIVGFDVEPAAISSRLALTPTESWNQGDDGPFGARNFAAWRLFSRCNNEHSIDAHILDVLAQLEGRESVVFRLSAECRVTMQCVAYMSGGCPNLSLDVETMRTLVSIGVTLDVDLYLA